MYAQTGWRGRTSPLLEEITLARPCRVDPQRQARMCRGQNSFQKSAPPICSHASADALDFFMAFRIARPFMAAFFITLLAFFAFIAAFIAAFFMPDFFMAAFIAAALFMAAMTLTSWPM